MADYINIPGSDIYIAYSKNLGISGVFAGKYKGQDVAIKRITAAQSNKREIEVMAQLPRHPHTVRYITSQAANEGTEWFIVMELCKRTNLSHIIDMNKDLSLDTKITIVLHLLQGLKHLHDNNVTHRDLKPHNVLLSMDEKSIKICDFGLSKPVDSSSGALTKSRTSIGTEGWWSPESKKGREASAKTDIYSAGLISFHVLSNGGHAFGDKNSYETALVNDSPLFPVWTALERSLEKSAAFFLSQHLIKAMLQKAPEDRPRVAKVLAHPLFWTESTKVDFLYHLKDMFRASADFKSCIEINSDWVERMHLSDTECHQYEYDGKRLFKMAKDLSSSKPKEALATLFVKLVRKCISDFRKYGESGQSIFKSGKDLWTFFLTKFPSEILQIYDHLNELPEATTQEFAAFKALPGKRDLIPGDIIIPSHEETPEGATQLSDTIWMFPGKKLTKHDDLFEGEIKSGTYGPRAVTVKLAINNKQSLNEARMLANLAPHSHILSITQADIYRGGSTEKIYMVLEKCHSENLHEFITNRKNQGSPLDQKEALEIVNQIIVGMTYVHNKNIIHKNIAPHNILFSAEQKTIRIAGFGSSVEIKSVSAEISGQEEDKNCTPGYGPPEFYEVVNAVISQKSDIFSLGATFYFVLTNGENPFGDNPDIWVQNIKKGIISLEHPYLTNMEETKNYIKHMIDHKPKNRPTIWQVSEQSCWTYLDRAAVETSEATSTPSASAKTSKATSSQSAASTTTINDSVETACGEHSQEQDVAGEAENEVAKKPMVDPEKGRASVETSEATSTPSATGTTEIKDDRTLNREQQDIVEKVEQLAVKKPKQSSEKEYPTGPQSIMTPQVSMTTQYHGPVDQSSSFQGAGIGQIAISSGQITTTRHGTKEDYNIKEYPTGPQSIMTPPVSMTTLYHAPVDQSSFQGAVIGQVATSSGKITITRHGGTEHYNISDRPTPVPSEHAQQITTVDGKDGPVGLWGEMADDRQELRRRNILQKPQENDEIEGSNLSDGKAYISIKAQNRAMGAGRDINIATNTMTVSLVFLFFGFVLIFNLFLLYALYYR